MNTSFFLTAGGSKAAFQWGAMCELWKEGIQPDKMWGTSGGALNALLLSAAGPFSGSNLWRTTNESDIYEGWPVLRLLLLKNSLYSSEPLKRRVFDMVDSKTVDVPVNVIAVNLETGEPQVFSHKDPDFDKAVLASASIPGVFPPVNIRGDWYVDGAVREYTPLSYVLSDREVERVVVISTKPRDSERRVEVGRNVRLWEIATSTLPIMADEIFMGDFNTFETINRAVQQAEENGNQFLKEDGTPYKRYDYIYVEPEENFGSALDFNPERNKRLMAAGRKAARKSLDNYL